MKTDNELIAEFMGMVNPHPGLWYIDEDNKVRKYFMPGDLKYHQSWDWLMPVVQAIEDVEEPHQSNDPTKGSVWPYQFEILSRSVVQIIDNRNDESIVLVDDQHHRKIDSVYKAVVEFIKWFNTQNQTN